MGRFRSIVLLGLMILAQASSADLRVMTFNVRYPAKGDGENLWDNRRDLLVDTIRKYAPDVIGTQELFYDQGQYIVEKLPQYKWFGLSRRGNHEDEHMGVFYRGERLELLESGNFWLSEKPEEPGSMSWNVTLPRMVTWGVFKEKSSGRSFHFYNTHFAHRGADAEVRVQSARVLAERLRALPQNAQIMVTGDFNTDAGTEPYNILTQILKDARKTVPAPSGPEGTFHGFSGNPGKARIDWILYRGLQPLSLEAITMSRDGRYPSDHFPVIAIFKL